MYVVLSVLSESSLVYLNPLSRMWEIGLGCTLGYLHDKKVSLWLHASPDSVERVRHGMGLLGMTAILWSAIVFDESVPFPSWRALVRISNIALCFASSLSRRFLVLALWCWWVSQKAV